jgi:hypothetical protein
MPVVPLLLDVILDSVDELRCRSVAVQRQFAREIVQP